MDDNKTLKVVAGIGGAIAAAGLTYAIVKSRQGGGGGGGGGTETPDVDVTLSWD